MITIKGFFFWSNTIKIFSIYNWLKAKIFSIYNWLGFYVLKDI